MTSDTIYQKLQHTNQSQKLTNYYHITDYVLIYSLILYTNLVSYSKTSICYSHRRCENTPGMQNITNVSPRQNIEYLIIIHHESTLDDVQHTKAYALCPKYVYHTSHSGWKPS